MAEKKKYIEVKIPLIDSPMRVLGTVKNLKDKTIKLDLTRRMKGKGATITFKIFNHEESLIAIPKRIEIVKAYLRRMMRKRADYVEDSFLANCSDIRAIVKPFLVTRKRVSRAVRKNLRNTCKEFLLDYLKEREFNDVCHELTDGILQKALLPKLKKVYPLSFCDIRIFETKELEKINLKKILQNKKKEEPEAQKVEEETQEEPEENKTTKKIKERGISKEKEE